MFVVALTRWKTSNSVAPPPTELEQEAQALAPMLGAGLYELRLALAAPPPVVLMQAPDLEPARQLLSTLRARGHGAVACDASSVASSTDMLTPKSFVLEESSFVLEGPDIGRQAMAYSDIAALLCATHITEAESTHERTEKKFSLGRAALSGGLVRSKTQTVTERHASQEREPVLYVMHGSGSGHVLLRQARLHYTGLGARLGRSAAENFASTVALLRERAPGARFDDRLLKHRRTGGSLKVSGTSAARTVTLSNDAEVDLLAHLLTVALLQGQA